MFLAPSTTVFPRSCLGDVFQGRREGGRTLCNRSHGCFCKQNLSILNVIRWISGGFINRSSREPEHSQYFFFAFLFSHLSFSGVFRGITRNRRRVSECNERTSFKALQQPLHPEQTEAADVALERRPTAMNGYPGNWFSLFVCFFLVFPTELRPHDAVDPQ